MISQNIIKLTGDAMKARDSIRVSVLRMLSSELKNEKINLQRDLTEEEELKVTRKEAKKRKEAIETYEKLKESKTPEIQERIKNESEELKILQEFLPAEVTEEEVNKLIDEAISETSAFGMKDMGRVIAFVKQKNSGVDGAAVANIVRLKLSNG